MLEVCTPTRLVQFAIIIILTLDIYRVCARVCSRPTVNKILAGALSTVSKCDCLDYTSPGRHDGATGCTANMSQCNIPDTSRLANPLYRNLVH